MDVEDPMVEGNAQAAVRSLRAMRVRACYKSSSINRGRMPKNSRK